MGQENSDAENRENNWRKFKHWSAPQSHASQGVLQELSVNPVQDGLQHGRPLYWLGPHYDAYVSSRFRAAGKWFRAVNNNARVAMIEVMGCPNHSWALSQLGHRCPEFKSRIDGLLAAPDPSPQPQVGHSESGSRSSTPGVAFATSAGIAIVMHNNIEFLVQERDAGAWHWEYTIGELIKSGEFVVSSRKIAARKVRQMIERDLRMQYLLQRDRGIRL